MALVGRLLEAHGFRVGILAQPDWRTRRGVPRARPAEPVLGRDRRQHGLDGQPLHERPEDPLATTRTRPTAPAGLRPDRSVIVYAQRCREAFGDVPLVIGGIEASLRRIAHYDYWSDKVRRSMLVDAQRRPARLRQRRARDRRDRAPPRAPATPIDEIRDVRGTAFLAARPRDGFAEIDSTTVDAPGRVEPPPDPYAMEAERAGRAVRDRARPRPRRPRRSSIQLHAAQGRSRHAGRSACRLRAGRRAIRVLYAHASRILHLEANPGNARALVQRHGDARRLDQPAADAADDAGDGRALRAAVPAPAAPAATRRRRSPRTR